MMGKQDRLQISGRLLAKNTLLNFIGQAVPLLVGVITIPFVVWGLGTERFEALLLEKRGRDPKPDPEVVWEQVRKGNVTGREW